jgi:alkylation response protein AidB-like acyl-CoA dehydrogenase
MDFDLSDDELALRDGARALLDDLASAARIRAHTERGDAFDEALWRAMAEQGWLGIEVPENEGGVGLGAVEAVLLCEELGRHAAPVPFASTVLALDVLTAAGVGDWVERLLHGDAVACIAWDPGAPVPYAPSADFAIVLDGDAVYFQEMTTRPRASPRWISRASSGGSRSIRRRPGTSAMRPRRPVSSIAARRSRAPICSAARRARSILPSSTQRIASNSANPSVPFKR